MTTGQVPLDRLGQAEFSGTSPLNLWIVRDAKDRTPVAGRIPDWMHDRPLGLLRSIHTQTQPVLPIDWRIHRPVVASPSRTGVRSCGDAWFRQGLAIGEREPRMLLRPR